NNTQIANTAFVMAAIAALVDSSPDALNTLNELAAALGNDPNFATTMTNALAGKQPKDATLTALAELATSADKLPYFTGADRAALTALTSVGRAILGKTSTQGVLDYLGLKEAAKRDVGTGTNQLPDMSAFTKLLSTNGYQKLPGGLIIQWGLLNGTTAEASGSYPIAFPGAILQVVATMGDKTAGKTDGITLFAVNVGINKSTLTVNPQGTDGQGVTTVRYIAIGY
ncbi:hypothetical protein LC176_26005, partial [Escherichia coli]